MRKDILYKQAKILVAVFAIYILLIFIYDLYFHLRWYEKVCSTVYCFENIEFKDYASILATLIGSAFVAIGLFSWREFYVLGLEKKDLEDFRGVVHEKMQNIEMIYGCFYDQYTYINECIKTQNLKITSFSQTIQNYAAEIEETRLLRKDLLKTNNKFRLHRKYFIIYGGTLNQKEFDNEFHKFILIQDKIMNSIEEDDVNYFLTNFTDYEDNYRYINSILVKILANNINLLRR
ncbi:hypothetical protein ABUS21_12115 [Acinetobacter baumannii]|uniref:hypothetical protein n=1 Tax=Acinetobacter baumannii TaxID=470 RepID=UPI003CFCF462